MAESPTLLVTAFEPFGGADVNPSACVAEALSADPPAGVDARVVTAVLPVVAAAMPERLANLIARVRPDAIVSLGEARGSDHVRVERVAVNLLDFAADNSGAGATDLPIVAGGPVAYRTTLPERRIRAALLGAGISCDLSLSAGTYLCNQAMYLALHWTAARRPVVPAGFIHLPPLTTERVRGLLVERGMELGRQVEAVRLALRAVVGELIRARDGHVT